MEDSTERVVETRSNPDGTIMFRRSDGTTIWEGGASAPDRPVLQDLIKYTYSTVANPPPNPGHVRSDAGGNPVDQITAFYIHRMDADNRDVKFLLMQQGKADRILFIQDLNNSDSNALFTLMSDPVDNHDYLTLNVELLSVSGVPLAGTGILLGIMI
jgi:hypothetical protein